MRSSCHFVPVLVCALALPGCFLNHAGEGDPPPEPCFAPAGSSCCQDGRAVSVGATACPFACPAGSTLTRGSCAGEPIDAGMPPPPPPPPPPPLDCPLTRASGVCFAPSFAVTPDVPFELPLAFDTCGCCVETECEVEVDEASRTLRVWTTLCPDPCDCDACVIPIATCSVPGLSRGDWRVVANDAEAFTLPVTEEIFEQPPGCATFASVNECGPSESIALHSDVPDGFCVSPHPYLDRDAVIVTWSCPDCRDLSGPCVVELEERLTDDLPAGGELRIAPTTAHRGDCDRDCPPACFARRQQCLVPPLVDGHFYRVWYDGAVVHSFTAGVSDELCAMD